VTAPCFRGEQCPDCADDPDLPCPEAVNTHAIRRGSITHFLTEDIPIQIVGDRMDVSREVLEEHYDNRSEEIKLEQRRRTRHHLASDACFISRARGDGDEK
jgi:hypothetical protein